MTQINYAEMNLTDAVYNELAVYDTINDEENLSFGDGILNDEEITNIGDFDAAAGMDELRAILKPYGYRLVSASFDEDSYLVKPEKDCPEGQRYIPDGIFEMGSVDGYIDERPVHDVGVSGFCADETETTNESFNDWVETVPGQKPHAEKLTNNSPAGFDGADQPVVRVAWKTATAYCASRTDLNGEPMRLPTEAQQERMARGVSGEDAFATDDGTLSPEKANYYSSDIDKTTPVASHPANSFGLYDVAGNAREWGADWYGDYSAEFAQDPTGPETGDHKVLRGGSWLNGGHYQRSLHRGYSLPDARYYDIGFRCVSSPRTPEE